MKDILITIVGVIIGIVSFFGFILLVFNFVAFFSCYASEGVPYWNKVVVACDFEDIVSQISTQITSISSEKYCVKNGELINCSYLEDKE